MSTATEITTMLTQAGLTAFDTEVVGAPSMYVVVTDRDPGLSRPHRMSLTPHSTRTTIDVRLVARTTGGLRALTRAVKRALSGHRLPSGPVMQELEVSPWMTTGTATDRRHETTIAYRTHTPLKEQP